MQGFRGARMAFRCGQRLASKSECQYRSATRNITRLTERLKVNAKKESGLSQLTLRLQRKSQAVFFTRTLASMLECQLPGLELGSLTNPSLMLTDEDDEERGNSDVLNRSKKSI